MSLAEEVAARKAQRRPLRQWQESRADEITAKFNEWFFKEPKAWSWEDLK